MKLNLNALRDHDTERVAAMRALESAIDEDTAQSPLRIVDARSHPVLMPWIGSKRDDGVAEQFTFTEFVTDAGLVGVDERGGIRSPSEAEGLRERVVGKSPFDPSIRHELGIAYWDFVGKVAGQPLYRYLIDLHQQVNGERIPAWDWIPFAPYTWHRFPDLDGEGNVTYNTYPSHLKQVVAEGGYRVVKMSVVDYEPHLYIDLLRRVRETLGDDIDIRIDPHGSWNARQATTVLRAVEDVRLEYVETPIGGALEVQFRETERLRSLVGTPVSSHSWLPPYLPHRGSARLDQPLDYVSLGKYDAADISAPDAEVGPLALKRVYDIAKFVGMGCTQHSSYELGVRMAFRLHASAFAMPYEQNPRLATWSGPTPGMLHALDMHYNQWRGDGLVGGKMPVVGGGLNVPNAPGLGVSLDAERLAEYAYSVDKAARYAAHLRDIRARYADETGWRRDRNGWFRPPRS